MIQIFIFVLVVIINLVRGEECELNESCVTPNQCESRNSWLSSSNFKLCEGAKICCPTNSVILRFDPEPLENLKCGSRSSFSSDDEETTVEGEFPWMILVLRQNEEGSFDRLCSGSLISPNVVLTTVHSLKDEIPSNLKVRADDWNLNTNERNVVRIVKHQEFRKSPELYNDIALLFLKTSFELSNSINVVCLPPQGLIFDHKSCIASGWVSNYSNKETIILKKAQLKVIPRETCQKLLRQTILGSSFNLNESFLCAGGILNEDSCIGDGGSPLICPITGTDQFYQAGIVSWGVGCHEEYMPGVYVHVSAFKNWIEKELEGESL